MLDTVRYEGRQRLFGSVVLAGGLATYAGMVIAITPGVIGDVDMQAIVDQLPPAVVESMGLEHLGTVEGFIAIELYQFIWLIGLGAYAAYSAAGTIVGDIETGRLDTVLAAPISRRRLLAEKYLAAFTPFVLVNVVVFLVVYWGAMFIDDPIAITDLVMVHVLSLPYLLACLGIGMVASVVTQRRRIAEGIGAGAVIGAFLLESVVTATDVSWVGVVAPMRYYDPLEILTTGTYDLTGATILLAGATVLVGGAAWWFTVVDLQ